MVRPNASFISIRANWRSIAMPLGAVGSDYVNLNIDSLWTGGPFENSVRLIKFPILDRCSGISDDI